MRPKPMRTASAAKPMAGLTRKEFLKLGLAGDAALALPFGTSACSSGDQTGALLRSSARLPKPFSIPLPIPGVLEPVRTDAGADYYEITQREGRMEILPGLDTTVWGYDGLFPGSTIEARRGRRVVVLQRNELPVPTVVVVYGFATLGVLFFTLIVVGVLADYRNFDRTTGGYEPPYTDFSGEPIDWSQAYVTASGMFSSGHVLNTHVDCTSGMISFEIFNQRFDWRELSAGSGGARSALGL